MEICSTLIVAESVRVDQSEEFSSAQAEVDAGHIQTHHLEAGEVQLDRFKEIECVVIRDSSDALLHDSVVDLECIFSALGNITLEWMLQVSLQAAFDKSSVDVIIITDVLSMRIFEHVRGYVHQIADFLSCFSAKTLELCLIDHDVLDVGQGVETLVDVAGPSFLL